MPGIEGYGESYYDQDKDGWLSIFDFWIEDALEIPADLEPGNYVLSFRWDCERTPQIWNTCSNIEVKIKN